MASIFKKLTHKGFEESTRYSTRSFGKPLPKTTRRIKKELNRAAKHEEARLALKEELN